MNATEAQSALSLPSTPAFRVEFNLGNVRAGYGSIAEPMYGQSRGGAEFVLGKIDDRLIHEFERSNNKRYLPVNQRIKLDVTRDEANVEILVRQVPTDT